MPNQTYSKEYKLDILILHRNHRIRIWTPAKALGCSTSTISNWISVFGYGGIRATTPSGTLGEHFAVTKIIEALRRIDQWTRRRDLGEYTMPSIQEIIEGLSVDSELGKRYKKTE